MRHQVMHITGMVKRPRDPNQLAKAIVEIATGQTEEAPTPPLTPAQQFAQSGGLKGGKARAAVLTPQRRKLIAKRAAKARWSKKKP
jgi:hypothetical protein